MRVRSSFPAESWERSPTDPTGPCFLIEDIYPCVDGGRYPVKRIAGESVEVWADIFREGHEVAAAALLWRPETSPEWRREPMRLHNNDRWHGCFSPPKPGAYLFAIEAWTNQFASWRKEFMLRKEAGQDLSLPAREGHELLAELKPRDRKARLVVEAYARKFAADGNAGILLDDVLAAAMEKSRRGPISRGVWSFHYWPNASVHAAAPGTKWCRAARAPCPASTARSTIASRACRRSRRSASMSSI